MVIWRRVVACGSAGGGKVPQGRQQLPAARVWQKARVGDDGEAEICIPVWAPGHAPLWLLVVVVAALLLLLLLLLLRWRQ